MKRERRTQIDLMFEILKVCNNCGMNKTRIINLTNLNSRIGSDYIKFLTDKEYLIRNGNTYQTSINGKRFLEKINEIHTAIRENISTGSL